MRSIQYTIRNIPPVVDQVIRKRANQSGKSFNQTVVKLLSLQTIGHTKPENDHNFDWLFNRNGLDSSFDTTIESLSQVEKKLWK